MTAAHKKILKARTSLLLEHPFFGSLCLRMEPKVDKQCATAWTDGRTLAYNPVYVNGLSDSQVQGLMAHTVMHPACQHHKRRNGRNEKLWNVACDHSINWILIDAGIELPPKYLDDPAYHGLSADEIYSELTTFRAQEDRPALSDKQGESEGEVEWDGLAGDTGDGQDVDENGNNAAGDADGEAEVDEMSDGDDGGEAGSEQSGDPGGSGEVRDAEDGNQGGSSDESGTDEQWELALAQAAQQARELGELPGGLERLVKEVLSPKMDWRELLERFISDRARDDYSWTPPNKRFVHLDVVLPSLSHQKLPEVVLAIDTSGSVTEPEMDQFAAEVSGILEAFDTTIHIVYCDSNVTGSDSFARQDLPLELKPVGGGGTDYRPVFSWIQEQSVDPACLVYLTDMECIYFPENEPEYPVLWAQIGEGGRIPPFGDVLAVR